MVALSSLIKTRIDCRHSPARNMCGCEYIRRTFPVLKLIYKWISSNGYFVLRVACAQLCSSRASFALTTHANSTMLDSMEMSERINPLMLLFFFYLRPLPRMPRATSRFRAVECAPLCYCVAVWIASITPLESPCENVKHYIKLIDIWPFHQIRARITVFLHLWARSENPFILLGE